MKSLHPSPTAGSGRTIEQSAYPKPGDVPDRRIECAQCGWCFNPDSQAEGNTGGDGQTAGVQIQDTTHSFTNTKANLPYHLRGISTFTASSRSVKDPVVASGLGCPFCGSTNPRATGRYPDILSNNIDLTNQ